MQSRHPQDPLAHRPVQGAAESKPAFLQGNAQKAHESSSSNDNFFAPKEFPAKSEQAKQETPEGFSSAQPKRTNPPEIIEIDDDIVKRRRRSRSRSKAKRARSRSRSKKR